MIFTKEKLNNYISNGDSVLALLNSAYVEDVSFISHKWMLDSLPKRAIYNEVYGDLLLSKGSKKILDVGGGYCALTRFLIGNHDYHLLDIMAHDNHNKLRDIESGLNKKFWIDQDWYSFEPETYDIVIANDIFPNVDQRLELFLRRYLPLTKEIRISLTYHNTPWFYTTKRVDGDEIFCQLAYNGEQIKLVLDKFFDKDFEDLLIEQPSLFPNGRQISIIKEIVE
jgi:hypothetical protein